MENTHRNTFLRTYFEHGRLPERALSAKKLRIAKGEEEARVHNSLRNLKLKKTCWKEN
jgi:hypothetical protein